MQDARDLDRQLTAWLGNAYVAYLPLASDRVRPVGLWDRAWLTIFQLVLFLTLIPPSSYSTTS